MLNFPGSPSLNQYYSYGVRTWQWNGSVWNLVGSTINADMLNGQSGSFYRDAGNLTGVFTGTVSGTILSTQVSDFTEATQDVVGSFFTYSNGITGTYNDAGNTLALSGVTATATELGVVRGGSAGIGIITGSLFLDTVWISNNIGLDGLFGVADIGDALSGDVLRFDGVAWENSPLLQDHLNSTSVHFTLEDVEDRIATGLLRYTNGITGVYNDAGNTLTLSGIAATTTTLGVASFSSSNFSVTAGAVSLANDAVSNTVLANMAQNTIKGRVSAGAGDPEDLTHSQVETVLTGFALLNGTRQFNTALNYSVARLSGLTGVQAYQNVTYYSINTVSGAVRINLPAPSTCTGRFHMFKKTSADTNQVLISGSSTIDGDVDPFILYSRWDNVSIISDGEDWMVTAYHFE